MAEKCFNPFLMDKIDTAKYSRGFKPTANYKGLPKTDQLRTVYTPHTFTVRSLVSNNDFRNANYRRIDEVNPKYKSLPKQTMRISYQPKVFDKSTHIIQNNEKEETEFDLYETINALPKAFENISISSKDESGKYAKLKDIQKKIIDYKANPSDITPELVRAQEKEYMKVLDTIDKTTKRYEKFLKDSMIPETPDFDGSALDPAQLKEIIKQNGVRGYSSPNITTEALAFLDSINLDGYKSRDLVKMKNEKNYSKPTLQAIVEVLSGDDPSDDTIPVLYEGVNDLIGRLHPEIMSKVSFLTANMTRNKIKKVVKGQVDIGTARDIVRLGIRNIVMETKTKKGSGRDSYRGDNKKKSRQFVLFDE